MHKQIEHSYTRSQGSVYGVLSTDIDLVWDQCVPHLKRAIEYSDEKYSLESIKNGLESRTMQLWVYMKGDIKACMVTQLVNYPTKRVCLILFLGGSLMHEWLRFMTLIEEWARSNHCEAIEIYGRPGWAKVLGWEQIHVVLRKNLHESTH